MIISHSFFFFSFYFPFYYAVIVPVCVSYIFLYILIFVNPAGLGGRFQLVTACSTQVQGSVHSCSSESLLLSELCVSLTCFGSETGPQATFSQQLRLQSRVFGLGVPGLSTGAARGGHRASGWPSAHVCGAAGPGRHPRPLLARGSQFSPWWGRSPQHRQSERGARLGGGGSSSVCGGQSRTPVHTALFLYFSFSCSSLHPVTSFILQS